MITFTEKKIELKEAPGKNARFELHFEKMDKLRASGDFFTDNVRIIPLTGHFSGALPGAGFSFDINVSGLRAGSEIRGNVTAASDCGEISVPVSVIIADESGGPIFGVKTLRDLTDLAERDFSEAYRCFMSPSFKSVLKGASARTEALWRGLTSGPSSPQRLEEFLSASGWKKPVNISIEKEKGEFYGVAASRKEKLRITRSSWGYLNITVLTVGDFIEIPIKQISDEDFVGSTFDLEFIILRSRLESAKCCGKIILKYAGGTLVYKITASGGDKVRGGNRAAAGQNTVQLTRRSLDFILGRCTRSSLAAEAGVLLGEMRSIGAADEPGITLFEAAACLEGGNMDGARNLMERLAEVDLSGLDPEARALILYLRNRTGITNEEMPDLADRMHSLYLRKQDSPLLMKLCMLTDSDLMRSPRMLMRLFEGTFEAGSNSPFVYAETIMVLRENSTLLVRITPFMLRTLWFAARNECLTKELALRAAFLAQSMKGSPRLLQRILAYAYGRWPEDPVLDAIVRLILRGSPLEAGNFKWYERAVNRGLRIIGLYEYYIETAPRSMRELLPMPIRKYFIYNTTLSADSRAFLYANIVRNRAEDPETYAAYKTLADKFTHESLAKGRRGPDYSVLTGHFIKEVPDGPEGRNLTEMLFTELLITDDPDVRKAVVIHRELAGEETFPVVRGTAYIRRYNNDAQILFENAAHERFRRSVVYSTEKIIDRNLYFLSCREKYPGYRGIVLSETSKNGGRGVLTEANEPFFRHAADAKEYSETFRDEMRAKLLRFYLRKPEASGFDKNRIDDAYLLTDKAACVEILLSLGQFDRAFRIIKNYGSEGIPAEKLVRLSSRLIADAGEEVPRDVTEFAAEVCREKKYDERILECLARFYEGSLEDMLAFRTLARDFYVNTRPIDERIIRRCVMTGTFAPKHGDILKNYAESGGDRKIIGGYLENAAAFYLKNEDKIDPYAAGLAGDVLDTGGPSSDELKLMYLKFCSQNEKLTVHQEVIADSLLEYFTGRGVRLGFFKKLPPPMPEEYGISDRTFVEIKADPSDRVVLNYKIYSGNKSSFEESAEENDWQSVPLTPAAAGIFSKEFNLFYGEKLVWDAEITHEGATRRTEKRRISSEQDDFDGSSAFQRINRMLKERQEKNREGLRSDLDDYIRARHQAEALFKIVEGR